MKGSFSVLEIADGCNLIPSFSAIFFTNYNQFPHKFLKKLLRKSLVTEWMKTLPIHKEEECLAVINEYSLCFLAVLPRSY
jgi:hypothetical protein